MKQENTKLMAVVNHLRIYNNPKIAPAQTIRLFNNELIIKDVSLFYCRTVGVIELDDMSSIVAHVKHDNMSEWFIMNNPPSKYHAMMQQYMQIISREIYIDNSLFF